MTISVDAKASQPDPAACPAPARDPLAGMLQRVWLRVRRRKAWLDSLNSAKGESPAVFFNDPDAWEAEQTWQASPEGQAWRNAIATADRWLDTEQAAPLRRLRALFQLTEAESDVLQLATAMRLDPTLGPVFGFLQGGHQAACLTNPLATRLFSTAGRALWQPAGNVSAWHFVTAQPADRGEAEALVADPILAHWLAGEAVPDACLVKCLQRPRPAQETPNDAQRKLADLLQSSLESARSSRFIIEGPPQSGRAALASAAVQSLGLAAVMVDTDAMGEGSWEEDALRLHRFALWSGLILIWRGSHLHRPWPRHLEHHPVHIILREPDQTVSALPVAVDHHLPVACLSIRQRTEAWRRACPGFDAWPEGPRFQLTRNYQLSAQQIEAIGAQEPQHVADAIELAKDATRQNLGDLGSLIDCPFHWDDIVLKEATLASLKDLAFEAQARVEFWETAEARRLFPRGRSLTALFTGSPGTGKTMAAQIIAAELGLDLYRVDLARVVSKYIGETAKHLRAIFVQAARSSTILLFDEADSLFSKRTDVKDSHDRYANADTGYLLQLLEDYQGLAILTTNKRGNIDTAFFRRIRYVYDFPRPEREERRQIWRRVLTALAGGSVAVRLFPALDTLAAELDVSAAQIKNAALAALFVAKRHGCDLGATHLQVGLERELAKDGRSIPAYVKQTLARS